MKRSTVLGAGLGMLFLILDSRCAVQSAREALELCLKSVIPSLFPMFVLSGLLVSGLNGSSGRFLSLVERIITLPRGGGTLFLLGILGGFPVGARCITQAVESGSLSRSDGERMLGFCNNCGPAFLFGIVGNVFSDPVAPLLIFLIQLESALLVGSFTAFPNRPEITVPTDNLSLAGAVSGAMRSMGAVCAWVILAGVVTGFLEHWILPMFSVPVPQIITGLLEITGGILGLSDIPEERLRFVLCATLVCFGGFSVWMQIGALAVPRGLSTAVCYRQKTIQSILGGILAGAVLVLGPVGLLIPSVPLAIRKKILENPIQCVYNGSRKGGIHHVVP